MMGNEKSQLNSLKIEDKATEITDFWSHYQATIGDSCRYFSLKDDGSVSVFKGEVVLGPLWATATPLEKYSNNLLKYRHPCIVRYISSWQQRTTFHLVTEYVQPLSHILSVQTPLQICVGLNNVLRALVFLHEQAGVSHNNVCISSIYVSGDGQWKLGGLQYLCSFHDLNPTYLKHAKIHRYDKAIDPDEESQVLISKVDQYGFAVLVDDLFKDCKDDEVPYLREFKKYCKDFLQNNDPANRPNLSEILQNLKCYDEETVAKQLGGLLLSRITLLDATARRDVIPYILKPKSERTLDEQSGFFSLNVFKEHVKPRLLQLFGVRDVQVRMLLLMHFAKFVNVFSHEELSQKILPELLLGIKDVEDNLVAATLACLSELVPILGADTVVGGKRSKLFTDGRPKPKGNMMMGSCRISEVENYSANKPSCAFRCSDEICDQNIVIFNKTISLNERPSPVGGESQDEDVAEGSNVNKLKSDIEDDWDDWDNSNHPHTFQSNKLDGENGNNKLLLENKIKEDYVINNVENITPLDKKAVLEAQSNTVIDISELDIKNLKIPHSKMNSDEIDFFADMTPILEQQKIQSIAEPDKISNKLNFIPGEDYDENEGWGEDWS